MTATPHKSGLRLPLNVYCFVLIFSAALYFIRPPDLSIYIFDVIWAIGLVIYPGLFLRMPQHLYLILSAFAGVLFVSIFYCIIDGRPNDILQAIVVLLRFSQIAICANFFVNCSRTGAVRPESLLLPALLGLIAPIFLGLLLYFIRPESAIVFNRYGGYLGNPNGMALYVVVVSPVFFSIIRMKLLSSVVSIPLICAFAGMSIYSLVISGSNSGILLFFLTLAVTFLGSWRSMAFAVFGVTGLYGLMHIFERTVIIWSQGLTASNFSGFRRTGTLILNVVFGVDTSGLGSQAFRLQTQEYIFHRQFSDPLAIVLGLGPGQSKLLLQQIEGDTVTIHNFYLATFAEFGILGSFAFAALVFAVFRRFGWTYRSWIVVSGILLASLGTPALYLPLFWVPPIAVVAALTLMDLRSRQPSRTDRRLAPRRTTTSLGLKISAH